MIIDYMRCRFMAKTAASLAALSLLGRLQAQTAGPQRTLRGASRTLNISGRAANVFGLKDALGTQALIGKPGERFSVRIENALNLETIICISRRCRRSQSHSMRAGSCIAITCRISSPE